MKRLCSLALLAATLSAQQSSSFVDRYDTRSDSTVRLNPGVYIVDPPPMVSTEIWRGPSPLVTGATATSFDGQGALEAFYDKQPVHIGDTLPRACAIGERFLKTDDPAGDQLYLCVSAKNHWNPAPAGETWYWYSPQQENQLREMAENNGLIYFRKTIRVKGINRPYTEITHTNKPSGYWPDYKLVTVSKGGAN